MHTAYDGTFYRSTSILAEPRQIKARAAQAAVPLNKKPISDIIHFTIYHHSVNSN